MHGMLETARQQPFVQTHRKETQAGVDCLVTGHGRLLNASTGLTLVIPNGSGHDARMKNIFYSLVSHAQITLLSCFVRPACQRQLQRSRL